MTHRGALCRVVPAVAVLVACQERLTQPSDCPELCPGTGLTIRDTTIEALAGGDSVFIGYRTAAERPALLTSDGLAAGEARTYLIFARRPDSISIDGVPMPYTIDSVVFNFTLVGRDTAAKDLRVILHRVPITLDTTSSFAEVDAAMTPATVVDSGPVADTLKSSQALRVKIEGEVLDRLVPDSVDEGVLGIGVRVRGDRPTGLRFSSRNSVSGPPQFITYARVNVLDTARQRQLLTGTPERDNYVINFEPPADPDLLRLGGPAGARALVRFEVPDLLRDSANVLRATLELTPVGPFVGLPNDTTRLEVRAVVADLGAKSLVHPSFGALEIIPLGSPGTLVADVRDAVQVWLVQNGPPPALFLGISPEGGSFLQPVFHSTRSMLGRPRIRITYALPTRPGNP